MIVGAVEPDHRAWTLTRTASGTLDRRPTVTIAFAKRKGANAVVVADQLLARLKAVQGRLVPEGRFGDGEPQLRRDRHREGQ